MMLPVIAIQNRYQGWNVDPGMTGIDALPEARIDARREAGVSVGIASQHNAGSENIEAVATAGAVVDLDQAVDRLGVRVRDLVAVEVVEDLGVPVLHGRQQLLERPLQFSRERRLPEGVGVDGGLLVRDAVDLVKGLLGLVRVAQEGKPVGPGLQDQLLFGLERLGAAQEQEPVMDQGATLLRLQTGPEALTDVLKPHVRVLEYVPLVDDYAGLRQQFGRHALIAERQRSALRQTSMEAPMTESNLPQGTSSIFHPRYLAYCFAHGKKPAHMLRHDAEVYPGGRMAGYVVWISQRWGRWKAAKGYRRNASMTEADHVEFDRWLNSTVTFTEAA